MDKFILDQLLDYPTLDSAKKNRVVYDSYSLNEKSDNKKLNRTERLIFLRVFKVLKKKFRRDNQLELANKLKAIFKEADQLRVFEYFSGRELVLNIKTYTYEYMDLPKEVVNANIQLTEDFLKKIGLGFISLNYYFFNYDERLNIQNCYALKKLKFYILDATPGAIVQMNKRLKLLKNKNKLT